MAQRNEQHKQARKKTKTKIALPRHSSSSVSVTTKQTLFVDLVRRITGVESESTSMGPAAMAVLASVVGEWRPDAKSSSSSVSPQCIDCRGTCAVPASEAPFVDCGGRGGRGHSR